MKFSVISPVYGAESLLEELVSQIEDALEPITSDYEIILVEDSSPDNSRNIIRQICARNHKVKAAFLSRNFGQQYALNAGLDLSTGDYVVTIDCDLQDSPIQIRNLYKKLQEDNCDIVYASRRNRQDGFLKKKGSLLFNKLMGYLTGTEQDESIANFVLYRRKVVDSMRLMGDFHRYYPLMNQWVGFNACKLPVPHAERTDGKASSYSVKKRIRLALETAVAFSTKPLRLLLYIGVLISMIALMMAFGLIGHYIWTGVTVSGWLTLFVSLWFLAGIIIVLLGFIAIYIGEIFDGIKGRPSYIISEKINL